MAGPPTAAAAPARARAPASQMLSPPDEGSEAEAEAETEAETANANGGSGHSASRSAFKCDQCERSFTRPSHLNRHRSTHLPPAQRNNIPCTHCERLFSRNDVLLRHLRSSHDVDVNPKNSYQKSCYRCVQKKLKCDRALPCRSCSVATAGVACEYPSDGDTNSKTSPGLSDTSANAVDSTPSHTNPSASTASNVGSAHDAGLPLLSAVASSHADDSIDSEMFLGGEFTGPTPGGFSFAPAMTPAMTPAGQLDFRGLGFDWLNFEFPDGTADTAMDYSWANANPAHGGPGAVPPPPPPPNPMGAFRPSVDVLSPVETLPKMHPWPFDQARDAAPPRYPLPPLSEVLQQVVQETEAGCESAALVGMAKLFSEHRLPPPDKPLDKNSALGLDLLQSMLESFFENFQPIQPIMHAPTWSVMDSSTTLLAAMACIGAVQSKRQNAAELAASISHICTRMINWLSYSDATIYSDIQYLAALCLHQIYSLGSGNRQLYQNADRTRGSLVASLRGLELLSSQLRLRTESDDNPPVVSGDPALLDAEWNSWAREERDRRIAWASFEYDSSLCTLSGRRAAVDLSEIPSLLPCHDALWEAPSAKEWAELRSRMPRDAMGVRIQTILRTAVSGNSNLGNVSVWGRRMASQVIGRMLWDMKQFEIISAKDYFGLPSLFNPQRQSKLPFLKGLDCLLASLSKCTTRPQLVSYNIAGLLCHYSHLYASEDIMDMVLYIVRNTVSPEPRPNDGTRLAKNRLIAAIGADPVRSRRLLWHAGQIVAVANQYLVSAPCEIMRLFMGYIFIIAFARYCPRQESAGMTTIIDRLGHIDDHGIASWIHHGGPAQMGSTGDIFAPGATALIAEDARAIFGRLCGWGLSEKFAGIVQCFEASKD